MRFISIFFLISAVFVCSNALDNDRELPEITLAYDKCEIKKEKRIDIHDSQAKYEEKLKPFNFINFDKEVNWSYSNKDLPTLVSNETNVTLAVNGSNFNETYQLLRLNFIVNQNDAQISKHFIDNSKYPMELRLVNFVEGKKEFSVIGFFFKQVDVENPALKDLLEFITKNSTEFKFKLSSILPPAAKLVNYYRYGGAAINSSCKDEINWSLFEEPISISTEQLKVFGFSQSSKAQRNIESAKISHVYSSRKERRDVKNEDDKLKEKSANPKISTNAAELVPISFPILISALISNLFL